MEGGGHDREGTAEALADWRAAERALSSATAGRRAAEAAARSAAKAEEAASATAEATRAALAAATAAEESARATADVARDAHEAARADLVDTTEDEGAAIERETSARDRYRQAEERARGRSASVEQPS